MTLRPELRKRLLLHGLILLLPLIPFFIWFWLPNLAGYNSDNAIHALMAEDFQWPIDFYYWGQNRLGSFLPMLASPFYYLVSSGIYAVAIAQLILVVSVYASFQSLFPSWWSKFAVAVFSIIPIYPFLVQTQPGHPVLAQLFFLGVCFALFFGKSSQTKKAFWIPLSAFLALWSSELSAVALAVFCLIYYKELLQLARAQWRQVAAGTALGLGWLILAKVSAASDPNYAALFTTWPSFVAILQQHIQDLWVLMQFKSNKPGNSLLIIFILINVLALAFLAGKRIVQNRMFWLFFGTAAGTYFLVCASNWNAIMDRPLHHFTPAYIFFALAMLVAWGEARSETLKKVMPLGLATVHAVASIWFITTLSLSVPGRVSMKQAKKLIAEIELRHPAQTVGLIGSYWNTYSLDALRGNIISIPGDNELVRTTRYKTQVFGCKEIVVIKTNWRDDLPQVLEQHGYRLQKTSEDLTLDDFVYAYYRVMQPEELALKIDLQP